MALLPHLYARDIGRPSKEFRAVGRGGTKEPRPVENRQEHAQQLRHYLELIEPSLNDVRKEQARMSVPPRQRGIAIAVEGREDEPLFVSSSARSTTQGLKLLTLQANPERIHPRNQADVGLANFFVTRDTYKSLLNALAKYELWTEDSNQNGIGEDDEQSSRRPAHFKMFESASIIRPANIRDFWTDNVERFPRKKSKTIWEVWTRLEYEYVFQEALRAQNVVEKGRPTKFVETVVRNLVATPQEIQDLIRVSAAVVELRSASSFVSDYMTASPAAQTQIVAEIAGRIVPASPADPRIAILDTGINPANVLLTSSLPRRRCYSVSDDWAVTDHDGHGTKMAGVALFGDISDIGAHSPINLAATLESVVVTAPDGGEDVPAHDAVRKAVELVEQEDAARVFCLAQTAAGEPVDGRPTSTSSTIDQLIYADGEKPRLMCVAVGNVDHSDSEPYQIADYIDRNRRHGIQSPAQALNVLSIGAFTNKVAGSAPLVASAGDLSPTSRTSQEWIIRSARKPDIVMEGGNFEIDDDGIFSKVSAPNLVLTTSRNASQPLAFTGETSAATAAAARLASAMMARYPMLRAETVRGMMVHCANWTPAMLSQVSQLIGSDSVSDPWATLLSRFGWGTPDLSRLLDSTESNMTLIVEDSLRPYEIVQGNQVRLKEMKYFKLPWPTDVLKRLRQTEVEMRCTLSYFIEPDPHAIARNRYDRYPSHRLKFELRRFGETDAKAQQRYNALAEDDFTTSTSDDGWIAGKRLSGNGTLQHDIWRGPAYRLAERDGISVAPVKGWWADIRQGDQHKKRVHFSLIVSINVPQGTNVYQPVATAISSLVTV